MRQLTAIPGFQEDLVDAERTFAVAVTHHERLSVRRPVCPGARAYPTLGATRLWDDEYALTVSWEAFVLPQKGDLATVRRPGRKGFNKLRRIRQATKLLGVYPLHDYVGQARVFVGDEAAVRGYSGGDPQCDYGYALRRFRRLANYGF